MPVPTYDNFIEPVLRVLQQSPAGVSAKEVYEGAANLLHLDDSQRNKLIPAANRFIKIEPGGPTTGSNAPDYPRACHEESGV